MGLGSRFASSSIFCCNRPIPSSNFCSIFFNLSSTAGGTRGSGGNKVGLNIANASTLIAATPNNARTTFNIRIYPFGICSASRMISSHSAANPCRKTKNSIIYDWAFCNCILSAVPTSRDFKLIGQHLFPAEREPTSGLESCLESSGEILANNGTLQNPPSLSAGWRMDSANT